MQCSSCKVSANAGERNELLHVALFAKLDNAKHRQREKDHVCHPSVDDNFRRIPNFQDFVAFPGMLLG